MNQSIKNYRDTAERLKKRIDEENAKCGLNRIEYRDALELKLIEVENEIQNSKRKAEKVYSVPNC